MRSSQGGHELIRHVELGPCQIELAVRTHGSVQGQHDGASDAPARAQRLRQPLCADRVALLPHLLAGNAKAAQIEPQLPALAQTLGDVASAFAGPNTGHMAMQIHQRHGWQRLRRKDRPAK